MKYGKYDVEIEAMSDLELIEVLRRRPDGMSDEDFAKLSADMEKVLVNRASKRQELKLKSK